jgi:HEAT repeat protein
MRCRITIVAACLLVAAADPVSAQSKSPGKPAPPEVLGGKTLEKWIDQIKAGDPGMRETAIRTVLYFGEPAKAAVPHLLDVLQNDRDASCRVHACLTLYALADSVPEAELPRAVRVLSERVAEDPQAIVRFHAALAVGALGTKATAAIASLANRAEDPSSWELRRMVVSSLAAVAVDKKFGPDGRAVTAVANLLLGTENPERSGQVRLEAAKALGEMGRPADKQFALAMQALQKALHDPDKAVQIWAQTSLMKIDRDKLTAQGLSDLARHLKGNDALVKFHAARALLSLRDEPLTRAHIPDIAELLDDKEPIVVANAVEVLAGFGTHAKEAIPALRRVAEKKDQLDVIKQAAKAAIDQINGVKPAAASNDTEPGKTGSSAKQPQAPPEEIVGKTLKQWMADLNHADPSTRELAIQAVPYFGKPAKAAVPALVGVLKKYDKDAACRVHAAIALSALAGAGYVEEATEAVKALSDRADQDPQAIVRYHVVVALGSFGPRANAAIPSLVNRIHDPNSWELRRAVVTSLRAIAADDKLGPDERAVTAIANLLFSGAEKSAEVRMEAVMTLGALGRPAHPNALRLAVQALRKSASADGEPDKAVRIWAGVALMALDKITKEGLDQVAAHLKGKDAMAKVQAIRALGAMRKEAQSKIPDIINLLDDKDPMVVANAVEVLGEFGSLAEKAVPQLERIAEKKDQTEYFKQLAKAAIDQINNDKPKK